MRLGVGRPATGSSAGSVALKKMIRMSTVIQTRYRTVQDARYWAPVIILLVAAAFVVLVQFQPAARSTVTAPLLDSGEIEAVSFVGDATDAVALEPAPPASDNERAATLFAMDIEPLADGEVLKKWSRTRTAIAEELKTVDGCHANNECPAVAQRLIQLSSEGAGRNGRARVGLINRAVNLAISPTSDEAQWRVPDHWSAPFETLQSGRGDCEDYAIVKYLALLAAGLSEDDVKIVIVKNVFPDEDHAVAAARVDGEWLILDNRTLTLVRDTDLARAVPELVLDQAGVRRFVSRGRTRRFG
jgi:predicted transglutaminase-like cysteine proteinase